MQGVASAALKTRVALEALTATVPPGFWKASVVLGALVALVVPTPTVALVALLARVALVAWVVLETRKGRNRQL